MSIVGYHTIFQIPALCGANITPVEELRTVTMFILLIGNEEIQIWEDV
jgi:hypothetical protein